jgi:hypothetical protein
MSTSAANRVLRAGILLLGFGVSVPAQADTSAITDTANFAVPRATADTANIQLAFDWFSNAAPNLPGTQVRATRRVIPGPGGWICSPAGFGQHSTCYQG